MKKVKSISLLFLVILLPACAKADIATPAPTPEAIQVFYPPTLQFWADSLAKCASNNPQIALYFFPTYTTRDIGENDILLGLGQAIEGMNDAFLSQVGWDQLVIIVNISNNSSQLSQEEIQQIFSGQVTNWEQDQQLPIQVWALPDNDPHNIVFSEILMADHALTSEARLAPDADAMLEAISQNPGAIGYLPESILSVANASQIENLKIIHIPSSLNTELNQPVVAITQTEPQGLIRQLVVCLQNTGK